MKPNSQPRKIKSGATVKSPAPKKPVPPKISRRNDRMWALVIFLLAFVLYANTLPNKYLMDDFSVVSDNFVVKRGVEGIPTILSTPYRYGFNLLSDNLYRPLTLVMFAIEWQIAPDTPALGHFMNVLFFAFTSVLLFFLFRKILPGKALAPALIATLLWVFHPIHTEVVANIKSRDEIMSAFFLFLSVLAFLRYLETKKLPYIAGAMTSYLLGFFSKEGVITFLVLFPLIGWYFTDAGWKRSLTASALMLIPAVLFLMIRQKVLATYATPFVPGIADNLLVAAPGYPARLATAILILGKYLLLAVFPYQLVSDYSYNQIPITGWSSPLVWISFVVYGAAVVWSFMKIGKRSVPVFAILLFLVTMSIASNLFTLIGTSFAERLLFLPSAGLCLLAGVMLVRILPGKERAAAGWKQVFTGFPVAWAITGVILALFTVKTVARNAEWRDQWTLSMADVKRSPNSAHMRYYAGMAYREKAKEQEDPAKYSEIMKQAIGEFQACVQILPAFTEGYEQLGLAWYRMKNTEEAIRNYEQALKLNPGKAPTYSNLGMIFFERKDYGKAFELYKKATELDSNFADGFLNLGSMYGMQGKYEEAVKCFERSIRLNPDNFNTWHFLGITYRSLNMEEKAKECLARAEELKGRK